MKFKEEVIENLKQYAQQLLGVDPATLSAETRFVEDLACKSVHYGQFSAKLEDEYDVAVPYATIKRCETFADVADFIDEALC